MSWFLFRQNNSGGHFDQDPQVGLGTHVYIEADTAGEANTRAEALGIYFDGCSSGSDCDCCGDRWDRASNDDMTDLGAVWFQTFSRGWLQMLGYRSYTHALSGAFLEICNGVIPGAVEAPWKEVGR